MFERNHRAYCGLHLPRKKATLRAQADVDERTVYLDWPSVPVRSLMSQRNFVASISQSHCDFGLDISMRMLRKTMASILHLFQLSKADAESLFTAGVLIKITSMFIGVALLQRPILAVDRLAPEWPTKVLHSRAGVPLCLLIKAASPPNFSFLLSVPFLLFAVSQIQILRLVLDHSDNMAYYKTVNDKSLQSSK